MRFHLGSLPPGCTPLFVLSGGRHDLVERLLELLINHVTLIDLQLGEDQLGQQPAFRLCQPLV
ncbi:MAG: hypothetical protein GEV03_06770 [Streptosporangiales bacterium]|nr:hypothetical protein [Streptosporangiales bacterium]